MIRLSALLAATALLSPGWALWAQEPAAEPAPATETVAPAPGGMALSPAEVKGALRLDFITMPTPGELMAAVDKLGKPDWAAAMRPPIPTNYSSRAQMALNLGGLIADGFIAVEAEDAQQVKNIGKDILTLAKPLGVQQDIINRGNSLTAFAEEGQWETLREELEATQNEVKTAMLENQDEELIVLVTLGGWIRGVEAMSDYIAKHYSAESAQLLRQPAVARYLKKRVSNLPDKVKDDDSVKVARAGLSQIEKVVSFAASKPPTVEEVKELAALSNKLLRELTSKQNP